MIWFEYLSTFLLVFTRISAFFVVAPIFSIRNIPAPFKIGLSVMLSLTAFSIIPVSDPIPYDLAYIGLIMKETIIGLALGFIAYMFFTAVQVSGSFIDLQMGFGIANVIDPQTGAQSPLMGNFKFIFAVLLFLSFQGHHVMIRSVLESYRWIPVDQVWPASFGSENLAWFAVSSFTRMFLFAFQMAAPVVAALFITDVAMGLISRAVPQINIFIVGIPIKILVGFVMMIVVIPGYIYLFRTLFIDLFESMGTLLRIMGG